MPPSIRGVQSLTSGSLMRVEAGAGMERERKACVGATGGRRKRRRRNNARGLAGHGAALNKL